MAATLDAETKPVALPAAADLSTKLWCFGKMTSTGINVCTVAGERALGVIGAHYKKTPVAGDAVDFYIERMPLIRAGAAYNKADALTTDAQGRAITATAGANILGYAVEAAGAVDEVHPILLPFASPPLASIVSNSQTGPGAMVVYTFSIADAATADYDRTITDKFEVLDVLVQKRNGAGGIGATVTIKNAANAISDAIDVNDADTTLSRALTIDDAFSTIAAGGTLRCSVVDSGDSSILVTVIGVLRA